MERKRGVVKNGWRVYDTLGMDNRRDGDGVDDVGDCWIAGETFREECGGGTEEISFKLMIALFLYFENSIDHHDEADTGSEQLSNYIGCLQTVIWSIDPFNVIDCLTFLAVRFRMVGPSA